MVQWSKGTTKVAAAGALSALLIGGIAVADYKGHDCGHRKFWSKQELNLSVDQVKTLAEAHLIRRGNPNLKLGDVTQLENGMVEVRVVTQEDSLVKTMVIDPKTGRPQGWSRDRDDD